MKKLSVVLILISSVFALQAQDLIVHKNDGSEVSFPINSIDSITFRISDTETGTFTDSRDGNVYGWIKIGEQIWMAENLAYLPVVNQRQEESRTSPLYYVYDYEGTDIVEAKATSKYGEFGVLYNWPAARIVAPEGWHVPTDEEWKELEIFLGMTSVDADKSGIYRWSGSVGNKLKATTGWSGDEEENNSSGFNALPAGERGTTNQFVEQGEKASFWTATEEDANKAYRRLLEGSQPGVFRQDYYKEFGYSVRCVRDTQ